MLSINAAPLTSHLCCHPYSHYHAHNPHLAAYPHLLCSSPPPLCCSPISTTHPHPHPTRRGFYLNSGGTGRVVHRVAVFDAHGEITHVVSQMDIVK